MDRTRPPILARFAAPLATLAMLLAGCTGGSGGRGASTPSTPYKGDATWNISNRDRSVAPAPRAVDAEPAPTDAAEVRRRVARV